MIRIKLIKQCAVRLHQSGLGKPVFF